VGLFAGRRRWSRDGFLWVDDGVEMSCGSKTITGMSVWVLGRSEGEDVELGSGW